jgi:indolepyruvate ferredoxin oxidoreductase
MNQQNNETFSILNGNELVVWGGLEAGFGLYTGYPGSPLGDFFSILENLKEKGKLEGTGAKVVIANSEANGAAMSSGAKMAGANTLLAMKSMGLHVASDPLSVGNFASASPIGQETFLNSAGVPETRDIYPGVVVVVGDDPWSVSTSTPADSRYLFEHLHIPFLEPSTPQEVKDWVAKALELSQKTSVYGGILLSTALAEGGGRVKTKKWWTSSDSDQRKLLNPATFDLQKQVMVPPNSLQADKRMIEERFPRVEKVLEELNLDIIYESKLPSEVGFISTGSCAETLRHFLKDFYESDYPLYKLAAPYPLTKRKLIPYLKSLKTLIVVEEKRGFLEEKLSELCLKENIQITIKGKDLFKAHGGVNYEILKEKLLNFLPPTLQINPVQSQLKQCDYSNLTLPPRYPTFCPGCPHRETLSLLKDLRKTLKEKNIELITHGDVGCYSLSFLPPFKEMHDLSAMGQGGALGAGTDLFLDPTKNPSVVLMGDSTFFHSGMSAISNSLQLNHQITYILLDNDNTAMTGHQVTPATGVNVEGLKRPRQKMAQIVKALGVENVSTVNPSDRYFYQNLLTKTVLTPGTKVIVSDKECALTYGAKLKEKERNELKSEGVLKEKVFYQINTEVCEDCRACVEMTGCPGLGQDFDAYGTKLKIDPQICVNDSYCTKIKACPSFEKVVVTDYAPLKNVKSNSPQGTSKIPLPTLAKISWDKIAQGEDFRIVVTGVGGSGITTISRVLAEAALEMSGRQDVDFKFFDQKGLAQRNGSVTSHLTFFQKGKSQSPIIPAGCAQIVLSTDLLEGSRAHSYVGRETLMVIDENYQIPLSLLLDYSQDGTLPMTEEKLRQNLKEIFKDQLFLVPMKNWSQTNLNRPQYAATYCLGFVFQAGSLPFTQIQFHEAITRAIGPKEAQNNIYAFEEGRKYFYNLSEKLTSLKLEKIEENLLWENLLKGSFIPPLFEKLKSRYDSQLNQLIKIFPELSPSDLERFLHDQWVFNRGEKFNEYFQWAEKIKASFNLSKLEGTHLTYALRILTKTFFIKDEVWVAHEMISVSKRKRDYDRYSQLGKSYQVHHINRPSFQIGKRKLEFDLNPRIWMLKSMRHARFLRRLMPQWHHQEKILNEKIRSQLLEIFNDGKLDLIARLKKLQELDNIKGYRNVRYEKAHEVFKN